MGEPMIVIPARMWTFASRELQIYRKKFGISVLNVSFFSSLIIKHLQELLQ